MSKPPRLFQGPFKTIPGSKESNTLNIQEFGGIANTLKDKSIAILSLIFISDKKTKAVEI